MATSTPTLQGAAKGAVRSLSKNSELRVQFSCNAGTYATGGVALTLPTADARGKELKGVNILNPVDIANDRIYCWDGVAATPLIQALVVSTGAQVANSTDLSGYTLQVEAVYG